MKNKLKNLILIFLLMGFTYASAKPSALQEIMISIEAKNKTVKEVFNLIEKKSGYAIVYEKGVVDLSKRLSVEASNESVSQVLSKVLSQTGNEYAVVNNQIVITRARKASPQQDAKRTITGTVFDETGEPTIGASVQVPGSTIGTVTDMDGKFSLSVPANTQSLKVSYVGYQDQVVAVAGKDVVSVKLALEDLGLEEIIVIGYGTVKKRDLTGAVSSIKSDDLTRAPVTNIVEAMQGRVAGMDIVRENGQVGGKVKALVRGNRSLTADGDPIYIIDGIQGDINNLNPNDIASIDILKDASSTAIYGSSGANGVVIVTTKQAEKGKTQVDFDAYVGVNTNPLYPKSLQGDAWMNYLREGYRATNPTAAEPDDNTLLTAYNLKADLLLPYIQNGKWIDWVDETLSTGVQQNYSISIRSGGENTKGYFSLGYNDNQGIYEKDNAKRYTMRAGIDTRVANWLTTGVQTRMIWQDRNTVGSRLNRTFSTIPLGEVYNETGEINQYPVEGDNSIVSPIADNISGAYERNVKRAHIAINPYAEFRLYKDLTFKTILGTSVSFERDGLYNSDHTYMALIGSQTAIRSASYSTAFNYNYTWENILNYNTTINKDHSIGVTLITSLKDNRKEKSYAGNEGFLYDKFIYYNLEAGNKASVTSSYVEDKMMSYAARLNYSYQGKYLWFIREMRR